MGYLSNIYFITKGIIKIKGFPVLTLTMLMIGTAYALTYPYMSLFGVNELNMTPTKLGIFMSLSAVSGIILSSILARLSDRNVPRKIILIISLCSGGIGYAFLAFARDYGTVLVISIVFLGVSSASFPQLFAYARDHVSTVMHDKLAVSTNFLRMCFSGTWVFFPFVGALVIAAAGYRGLFIVASAFYLINALLVILQFHIQRVSITDHTEKSNLNQTKAGFSVPVLFSLCAFTLIETAGAMSIIALPLLITISLHGSDSDVGLLFGASAALEVPFMLLFGIIALKVKMRSLILLGAGINVVYYTFLSLVWEVWQVAPLQIISAGAVSILMGIGITYFQELMPGSTGTATTLFSNTSRVGSMVGGVATGFIMQQLGLPFVFVCCAILSAASFLLLVCIRLFTVKMSI
ncbi:sugar efflux transporter [Paenibacillus sp. SYP-B4298]|uniref:sugar efflux transporter n=1 Tax=Paenibacillus sp. SYP-B4298 TaxID=2996034 RepID=UPI0022DD7D6F|nr:sugar efflux transporter [Paenibacillus sp. SYP-B4298]